MLHPSKLIKGVRYNYDYKGDKYEVVYIMHTLNYRVFVREGKTIYLSESSAALNISTL